MNCAFLFFCEVVRAKTDEGAGGEYSVVKIGFRAVGREGKRKRKRGGAAVWVGIIAVNS